MGLELAVVDVVIRADDNPLVRGLSGSKRKVESWAAGVSTGLNSIGTGMRKVGSWMLTRVTLPIVAGFGYAVHAAAGMQATLARFNAVFGTLSAEANAWTEEFAAKMHRSDDDTRQFLLSLQLVGRQFGFSGRQALGLAEGLTEMAVDYASFVGAADSDVVEAFTRALMGQTRGLKQYAIVVNDAEIDQEIMRKGWVANAKDATEAMKAQAVYNLLVQKTAVAHGHATANAGNLSNSLKGLKADAKKLAEQFGTELIPAAKDLIATLKKMVDWFSALSPKTKSLIIQVAGIVAILGPAIWLIGTFAKVLAFAGQALTWAFLSKTGMLVAWREALHGATLSMATLGTAGLAVTVAVAGWEIGKWIADWTGLGDAIAKAAWAQNLFGAGAAKTKGAAFDAEGKRLSAEREALKREKAKELGISFEELEKRAATGWKWALSTRATYEKDYADRQEQNGKEQKEQLDTLEKQAEVKKEMDKPELTSLRGAWEKAVASVSLAGGGGVGAFVPGLPSAPGGGAGASSPSVTGGGGLAPNDSVAIRSLPAKLDMILAAVTKGVPAVITA